MPTLYKSALLLAEKITQKNPVIQLFVYGYFACTIVGWLLLQLPLCQKNSVSTLDTLFMAASAISTTGLATVDIEKTFSLFGQQILLLLIQLGGVGYMILSSFIVLRLRKKVLHFRRKNPLYASFLSPDLTITGLVKQVLAYTAICEIGGTLALYFFFQHEGIENSFWSAIFHCVSAFCTAGLSLFSSNFEQHTNHLGINITLSILSLMGAFGFFLAVDFFKKLSPSGFILHAARLIQPFATTAIAIGSLLFLLMAAFPQESSQLQQQVVSFFHIISAITTAGFNTIDLRTAPQSIYLLLIIMMLIGVALTGNGMNMKNTSFKALLRLTINLTRKKKRAPLRPQKVLLKRMQIATFTFTQYFFILLIFAFLLTLSEKQPFLSLLFEAASALCTVGLSAGITAELTAFGKSLLVFLMILGKVGMLIFGFATSIQGLSGEEQNYLEPAEATRI